MVTVITLTGISLGSLLGGTVIVETVFTWPGLGSLIMEGISQRDYPVVQAVIVWMASAFMVVNLLTDISYTVLIRKLKIYRRIYGSFSKRISKSMWCLLGIILFIILFSLISPYLAPNDPYLTHSDNILAAPDMNHYSVLTIMGAMCFPA